MPNFVHFAQTIAEIMLEIEINLKLKKNS